jgi:NADH dehydrogenase
MPQIKILIIGNGFGGVYALRNLHKLFHNDKKGRKIEITLVGEKNYFLFTPLLPEVATGGINPGNIIEPIRMVLGCCVDKFYLGKAEILNLKNHTVKVENNLIPYDYLIIAPGAETNFYNIPGAQEYSFKLKSVEDAVKIKNHCITQIERAMQTEDKAERKKMLKFVVVGGGATGVEMAGELKELVKESFSRYYPKDVIDDISIILIQRGPELVPQFGPKISGKSLEVLRAKGVLVMLDSAVKEVSSSYIILEGDIKIFTEMVIWVAGIKPTKLDFDATVIESPDGRLIVNEYLQLESYREVFAIGDIAFFKQQNIALPALAQVAEKQSRAVAKNIQLLIADGKPEKFFYKSSGKLLSLGRWMAIGEIFNITFSGYFTWLLWRIVYLSKLISWRKKARVLLNWVMNAFSPKDISQI